MAGEEVIDRGPSRRPERQRPYLPDPATLLRRSRAAPLVRVTRPAATQIVRFGLVPDGQADHRTIVRIRRI